MKFCAGCSGEHSILPYVFDEILNEIGNTAKDQQLREYCKIAKGSFGINLRRCALYYTIYAIGATMETVKKNKKNILFHSPQLSNGSIIFYPLPGNSRSVGRPDAEDVLYVGTMCRYLWGGKKKTYANPAVIGARDKYRLSLSSTLSPGNDVIQGPERRACHNT